MRTTRTTHRLLAAALVCGTLAAPGAVAQDDKRIEIGWTAWSDAEAVTRVTHRILEERLGYEVELTLLDIALQYSGLARGDVDLMLMAWLPNTHADYWQRVKDDVEDLGVLYGGASLGWVVPDYVPESELESITGLEDSGVRERLDGKIQGIDPGAGLMRLSKDTLEVYGLDGYDLIPSSGAGMTAALKRAVSRKDWIVVTGWRPHWMFGAFDLRYLDDPKGTLGEAEQIHALGRSGFRADHPQAAEVISRISIPLDELEALMYDAEQTSYEEVAQRFIAEHQAMVDYWVTGER